MFKEYPRDLIGYGEKPPHPQWPGRAKIALQFVVNFEEGGENCVLHGDAGSEQFLSEIIGAESYRARHLSMESIYEYGSRAGFWRLHRLFTQQQLPVTVFGVATALEKHPDAVKAMLAAEWEIACHGLRWIHYQHMSEADERAHIEQAIAIHEQVTRAKPKGWYTGRTSPNTLKLIAERDDLLYCADSYADDLPYWDEHYANPLLMVPYTLDTNDMRFATAQGFNSGEQFFHYLKDAFDELYREGEHSPKMLSIGLHCRLIGRPGRLAGLRRFIEYTRQFDHVWYATREQIAHHWLNQFPAPNEAKPKRAPLTLSKTESATDANTEIAKTKAAKPEEVKLEHVRFAAKTAPCEKTIQQGKTQAYKVADISSSHHALAPHHTSGTLAHVRVSVKDLFDVKGFKTGAGLTVWRDSAAPAQKHAGAVTRLVQQGAQLVHKTQLDQLAYSLAGDNAQYGVSRNPLAPARASGGSSSGAAVSLVNQACDLALATDTGGSIRVPSSYCGLYGLRPTHGRVPVEGLIPLAPRFDTAGLMSQRLSVLEQGTSVLLGENRPLDAVASLFAEQTLLWCEALWDGVDCELKTEAYRRYCEFDGPKRQIASPPLNTTERQSCFAALQAEAIWQTHGVWLDDHLTHFGADIAQRLRWGQWLTTTEDGAIELTKANRLYQRWSEQKCNWLPLDSILILPTVPSIAPLICSPEPIGTESPSTDYRNTLLGLTSIAGLSGWPQLQCPVHVQSAKQTGAANSSENGVHGLPHGLSLLGREGSDMSLFTMAKRVFSTLDTDELNSVLSQVSSPVQCETPQPKTAYVKEGA